MSDNHPLYFYGHKNEKTGYLSNFYETEFVVVSDGKEKKYTCSEQYFMYRKCETFDPHNNILLNLILNETNPSKIKMYGRKVNNYNEQIWKELRYDIMLEALRFKFTQNEDIKQKLIETKNRILYEASSSDNIWGIGFCYTDAICQDKRNFGQNLLGNALMQIREELSQ